jgi:hypothetical protein
MSAASVSVKAQQALDIAAPAETGGNYGTINFVDMSSLGHKQMENISYSDVSGSPFWADDWNSALFFLSGNRKAKVQKAKLDLYANEVRFIDKSGTELSLENTTVLKIIFFKGTDTTKVLSIFESLPDSLNPAKTSYYQILNNGKYQLLELEKVFVKESEYNPTTGKNDHSFFTKTSYAISDNENIIPIKLRPSDIFPAIHPQALAYEWLKQNNNKLKNVTEVISFLNYYNGILKP